MSSDGSSSYQPRRKVSRQVAANRTEPPRAGFTLVELTVVMAILGVLMTLLIAAVQVSREMTRKTSCSNNLRNQLLASHEFQAALRHYPAGRLIAKGREYSWCLELLPYLEQQALYIQFDRSRPWNDGGSNLSAAQTTLKIFRCASSVKKFPGKTDYGGVMGSTLTVSPGFDFENGVMIEVGGWRRDFLTAAEIIDGTSQTIAIAECVDRPPDEGGMWVTGFNAFSHDNGTINGKASDDICSRHPGGALVGFADGRVCFLSQNIAPLIVGALCTRNGGERVNEP
jgi:prepilin-type N-terminal cleavage/methylation domain-containing protein/prepilin-type processing-associated H-X9-DG protein